MADDPLMIQIAVQAIVGGKILARDDIKALRKDVAAKLVCRFLSTILS
jgi:translation elongation factor EF-4